MNKTGTLTIYDSAARRNPAGEEVGELVRYQNLIVQMVRRDIVARYKRSFLGVAWTMLAPLGTTLVLSIVFSQVFGRGGGYAGYVITGLMPWTFFSQSTSGCMTDLLWGGNLLKRVYLPRTVFSVAAVGTGMVNLLLSVVPLVVVLLLSGIKIHWTILLMPLPALLLAFFSLGLGLLLSAFVLPFPDISEMFHIVLTAWMYLSPIIYKVEMLPARLVWIIKLNPMYYLINLFRAPIYDGRIPTLQEWLVSAFISFSMLIVGWLVFTSKMDEFAYRV